MAIDHQAQSGESGQQGHDRQPGNHIGRSADATPDENQAASPRQVQRRSKKAATTPPVSTQDPTHPGPGRNESQKGKGDVHHQQREPQPDMQDEVEEL